MTTNTENTNEPNQIEPTAALVNAGELSAAELEKVAGAGQSLGGTPINLYQILLPSSG